MPWHDDLTKALKADGVDHSAALYLVINAQASESTKAIVFENSCDLNKQADEFANPEAPIMQRITRAFQTPSALFGSA